jgi:hypothetical protein
MKKPRYPIEPTPKGGKRRKPAKSKNAAGSFMGIPIADPAVRPRGVTVRQIRKAVAEARKRA